MNTAMKTTTLDLCRAIACAALATLTTFGTFSLVTNVMPPLVADSVALTIRHEEACTPTGQFVEAARLAQQSAI